LITKFNAAMCAADVAPAEVAKPVTAEPPLAAVAAAISAVVIAPAFSATLATEPEYFTPKRP
jgi:hypothetical protein